MNVRAVNNILFDLTGTWSLHGKIDKLFSTKIIISMRSLKSFHFIFVMNITLILHQFTQAVKSGHKIVLFTLLINEKIIIILRLKVNIDQIGIFKNEKWISYFINVVHKLKNILWANESLTWKVFNCLLLGL